MKNNYSIFKDGKYFGEKGSQSYLVFESFSTYFKTTKNGKLGHLHSKGMSEENITPPLTTAIDISFKPEIIYSYGRGRIKF